MDGTKKSSATSAMIELKAELFRKQEEFKRQKAAGSSFVKGAKTEKSAKGGLWSRQNAGVLARAEKDAETKDKDSDDDDVHAKSKRALEEKARLYDKLCNSSNIPDEDGSDYYLVDFQKKVIDSIVEDREASRRQEENEEAEAEKHALAAEIPEPIDPDEEWIDFKDSLGRDRRCMKKDLDQLMKQDRKLALAQSRNKTESGSVESTSQLPSLMSSDMHREIMRQKWENEMKELQEKGQEEIHYSNIRFDEIRNHGVGFFEFSKDHKTREEQLEDLKKMRGETLDEHSRKDRIKDKRKAMMEARLAKVRQRRNLKELPAEVKSESDHNSEAAGPKLREALLPPVPPSAEDIIKKEEMEKQAEEKRKTHIREWDKEKQKAIPNRKNYIDSLREEREQEFAPPSAYFKESKSRLTHASDNCSVKVPQSLFKTDTSSASRPIMDDIAHGGITIDECKRTCNSSQTQQSETATKFNEEFPPNTSQDQHPAHFNRDGGNNWPEPQHGYQNEQHYYHDQTFQVTHYGQGQPQLETPSFQQQERYQHFNIPQQGQQGYLQQQLTTQYTSSTVQPQQYTSSTVQPQQYTSGTVQPQQYMSGTVQPQQYTSSTVQPQQYMSGTVQPQQYTPSTVQPQQYTPGTVQQQQYTPGTVQQQQYTPGTVQPQQHNYFYGTDNQQFCGETFRKTGLPSNSAVPHLNITNTAALTEATPQFTSTSESTKYETDSAADGHKRPKIPKMAIMDMRYVKNEEMPVPSLDLLSANPTAVTAVPYTPGSFTAAKHFTVKQYEESIAESRLKNQISGTAVLYTAEQMKNQEQLQRASEENNITTDPVSD